MAIIPIEDLKLKFEGGDKPRSTDYINLIDTLGALPEVGDAENGVATGGTTGQVLVKVDETNYNTQWSNIDVSAKQDVVANVSSTEIGYLDGVTSGIQTQINTKAPTDSPTFTGTVSGVTKSHVGLGNVDNTSDANKPVSTAAQTALDLKAPLASPALTGTPTAPTATAGDNSTQVATTAFVGTAVAALVDAAPEALNTLNELAAALGDNVDGATGLATAIGNKVAKAGDTMTGLLVLSADPSANLGAATKQYVDTAEADAITAAGTAAGTAISNAVAALTKSSVGLGNVDNTSDTAKPISTATQTALDLKANASEITELSQDAVNTAIVAGTGLDKVYDDALNTITLDIDSTVATKSYVDTAVGNATIDQTGQGGVGITWNESTEAFDIDSTVTTNSGTQTLTNKTLTSPAINTPTGITKSDVGLGNVDNTSDANKPVSTATQTDLDLKLASATASTTYETISNVALKAPLASPTFTGTVSGVTKTMVGLGNVDNTADASKPVSTATQTALDLKLASATASTTYETITNVALKAPIESPTFTGTVSGVTKSHVGLANVDNTSDASKPVSTATQTALDLKLSSATAATTYQPLVANVSDTEIGYLDGVTSAIQTQIDTKAPLASPTFTGTVTIPSGASISGFAPLASPALTGTPTAPTAISSTNTTQVATTEYVKSVVSDLTNGAGAAYDTLKELQDLIVADESAASTLTTLVGTKAPIASPTFTGTVTIPTGALITSPTISGTGTIEGTFTGNLTGDVTGNVSGNSGTVTNGIYTTTTSLPNVTSVNSTTIPASKTLLVSTDIGSTVQAYDADLASIASLTATGLLKNTAGTWSIDTTSYSPLAGSSSITTVGTVTAGSFPAANLSGTTLASGVTASSLTSFGTTPTLPTGTIATTQIAGNSTTAVATTAFVTTAGNLKANIASPTFTGTVTTPSTGIVYPGSTSGQSILAAPAIAGTNTAIVLPSTAGTLALLASPTFTGTPLSTTAAVDTNTTQIATTAYVIGQAYLKSASLTAANISSGTLGSGVVASAGTTTSAASGIGYMGMPQTLNPTSPYTLLATDAGKHIYMTTTGGTITIPANGTTALPIGTTFVVINATGVTTTIAITTDTLILAGLGSTGSRSLAPFGMATAVKVAATTWVISGNGLS